MISANHKCLFFILLIVGIFRGYQCIGSDEENVGSDEENVGSNIEEVGSNIEEVGSNIEEVGSNIEEASTGNEEEMSPDHTESKIYPVHKTSSKPKTKKPNLRYIVPNNFIEIAKILGNPEPEFNEENKKRFQACMECLINDSFKDYLTFKESFTIAFSNLTIDDPMSELTIDYYNRINETIRTHILTVDNYNKNFKDYYESYDKFISYFNMEYYKFTIHSKTKASSSNSRSYIYSFVCKQLNEMEIKYDSPDFLTPKHFCHIYSMNIKLDSVNNQQNDIPNKSN